MKYITNDPSLIAACGLYCGACGKYLRSRCPGCRDNVLAVWCRIRKCCQARNYSTCAECRTDEERCRHHNSLASRIASLLYNSDRPACIRFIRTYGEEAYASKMSREERMTMKRR